MKTNLLRGFGVLQLWLFVLALPAAVQAQFNYVTNEQGTITITGGCTSGAVTIPSTINGLPVTSIGGYAFVDCTSLTSVTIPDSVTSIEDYAFLDCTSLTSVTIPDSVTSIGAGAFDHCTSLTSITIGNGVTSIGAGAFSGCSSLTNVTIPDGVTSIGWAAFSGCSSLTNVTIPDSVTSIPGYAFVDCTSLTSVTIPDSVISIGESAFYGCTSLTTITVDPLNASYSSVDGVLFDKNRTTLIRCPGGKVGSYIVPDSVTSIGNEAFWSLHQPDQHHHPRQCDQHPSIL